MTETIQFRMIPLSDVVPSPTNPRKFFDESATNELAESIMEKGVLQPILVRTKDGKYEVVCGERRYRASMIVKSSPKVNNLIPATVRELSDQEVREMQLIENFQRQDVHPMEEAVAIKAAIDSGKYTFEDIAAKVGKKLSYIRQRMKLNDLTADWQKVFYRNGLSIGDAVKLCALPAVHQKEIFKEKLPENEGTRRIEIDNCTLDKYKGDLQKATFDLTDATLDKKAGVCSMCQFNTAVSQLFPEMINSPRCTNITCFTKKSEIHFSREIKKAKEDPSVIFIYDDHSVPAIVEQLRKEGVEVLKEGYHDDCKMLSSPEKPDWADYVEDENYDSDHERKQAYEEALLDYDTEETSFRRKVATGKYKKAFVVHRRYGYGAQPGHYVYVEVNAKGTQKQSKKAIEEGNADVSDIDAEITRIKDRDKRNKELDGEKVWREINNLVTEKSLVHEDPLTSYEIKAAVVALYEKIGYTGRSKIEKQLSKSSSLSIAKTELFSINTLWKVMRIFILDALQSNTGSHLKNGGQMALKAMLEQYFPDKITEIEAAQQTRAEKRSKNVEKKLAELLATKKELQATAKPAKPKEKAPVKKAGAKKA